MSNVIRFTAAALMVLVAASPASAHILTYSNARKAAQIRADRYAGQRTTVNFLLRRSRHSYYAQAKWTSVDPHGCSGCGYDPATGTFYDTPTREAHSIAMAVGCIRRAHTRANRTVRCSARANITDVFG